MRNRFAIIALISAALEEVGASLEDAVRTVTYVKSMNDVGLIAKAHAEAFGTTKPASTLIEVSNLTPGNALVELEVTAVVEEDSDGNS